MSAQVVAKQLQQLDKKDKEKDVLAKEAKLANERVKQRDQMIKQLKQALEAKEPEDIEIVHQSVTMNNKTTGHTCNACERNFRTSQDLENHMAAKHEEKHCTFSEKMFGSEQELVRHHIKCIDHGVSTTQCNKCDKLFTNFALKKHIGKCQGNQEYDCPECGQIYKTAIGVKKHYDLEHKMEAVSSNIVCKWWRKGNCTNRNCRYAHVGQQNKVVSESTPTTSARVPACQNGSNCDWLKKGRCSFFHPKVGVQKPWDRRPRDSNEDRSQDWRQGGGQGRQQHPRPHSNSHKDQVEQSGRTKCKFDGRCDRIPNCPHIHSLEDFPRFQGRRNPVTRRQNSQKRN